ncbi:hypothetical protein IQ268_26675 [Oculatella sp. LEGE 06141]|uniref:hypothetical protein n=1 Tax=Oculatella sp. LEGE 06141 TaxID=1828648 RepID=UPI00187FC29D|nr:hypothetical protein [Oculatella sp. LEGE 06141]MBE9182156.1 hypothetical protein [Oculatella sp. LEGE 06141]
MSKLNLEWKRREGGDGRTKRDYLDIIVDDQPLSEVIGGDVVSCLGWFVPEENAKAVHRLLLEEVADLPNNRCSLYVCPECGDLGCGAVSLAIEQTGDKVIWRDFGYENNYESVVHTEGYKELGPFIFDRSEYVRAIKKAL